MAKTKTEPKTEAKKEKYVRPSWDDYFLEIADTVAKRATCDRGRSGCVIARGKQIDDDGTISQHCVRTVHAEQNALCQAAKLGIAVEGATLYCRMTPCRVCAMLIINCGIRRVVCEKRYHSGSDGEALFREAGVELVHKSDEILAYEGQKAGKAPAKTAQKAPKKAK